MNIYDQLYDPNGIDYGKTKALQNVNSGTERERFIWNNLCQVIAKLKLQPTDRVLEIGASMGYNHRCHPHYLGIEYSKVAVIQAKKRFGLDLNLMVGDVTCLEFDDESFDFIFSFSTLEHVPDIEKAFVEITRVLRVGGRAYLWPAWNCRSWTVEKIDVIPYRDLSLKQIVSKFLIPIRENILFRFAMSLPLRLIDEMYYSLGFYSKLRYRRLYPKMDLITKYGHTPDDDAYVSIDSHSAILWFLSRGLRVDSHRSFLSRILCRGEAILISKPSTYGRPT